MKLRMLLSLFLLSVWGMLLRPAPALAADAAGGDSLRVSLLTCAAGEEIYSLFGHTAIRCENLATGEDVVYNYGVFDFSSSGFVLRFALGETDYRLDKEPAGPFFRAYYFNGRDIWQQELNLTAEEKRRLVALLEENYRPENRIYRYNFFYDNCSTRPRDKVEEAVDGRLVYPADTVTVTYRDLTDRYSEGHPWSRLGMSLCLGSEADKPVSRRAMQFVPFLLQADFSQTTLVDSVGRTRPLVAHEGLLLKALQATAPDEGGLAPMTCAWLLFGATLALTVCGIRRRKAWWGVDVVLFAAAGLAGCVLAFLACFSQHPCMSPNYLLFVFHPLHLLCLPWLVRAARRGQFSRYLMLNLAVLTLFMVFWGAFPQKFPPEVLPLALCLWMRSLSNGILARKKR